MGRLIDLAALDRIKPCLQELTAKAVQERTDVQYVDMRCELQRLKSAYADCGTARTLTEDISFTLGVKVIAGASSKATGYFGQILGRTDLTDFGKVAQHGLEVACERAMASAQRKVHLRKLYGHISASLADTVMAPVEQVEYTHQFHGDKDPDSVSPQQILSLVQDISQAVQQHSKAVRFNRAYVLTAKTRKLFCSSEGTCVDRTYPLTEGIIYVVAGDVGEEQWDVIGNRRGWEVLEGQNVAGQTYHDFALELTAQTIKLSQAPVLQCDPTKEVVVVTDPHYNALLVHEICGHPTEADRILKLETAYAGRSWFFRSFDNNEIGKQVAAPNVSVYSDPTITGYGGYSYDAQGVKAVKVALIENGILKDFMHDRETAYLLKMQPNGCSRANNASFVPLVRMTNVVFGNGSTPPEKLIAEVDEGYYLKYHRIPSISESRENFRITCRLTYKIEKGRLTQLYRNGGMTSDSRDYLMSIDGVGNDFENFPVPHCGKGSPMQTMRVGNGGPTLRGRARLSGSNIEAGGAAGDVYYHWNVV